MLKKPALDWKTDFITWLQASLPDGFHFLANPSWTLPGIPDIQVDCDLSIAMDDCRDPRYLLRLVAPEENLHEALNSIAVCALASGCRHLVLLIHGKGDERYTTLGPLKVQLLYHDFSTFPGPTANDILDSIFDE